MTTEPLVQCAFDVMTGVSERCDRVARQVLV
jgi:hypothetical protein